MSQPSLTAEEMLAWLEKASTNWRALIEAHPERPTDISKYGHLGDYLGSLDRLRVSSDMRQRFSRQASESASHSRSHVPARCSRYESGLAPTNSYRTRA